MTTNFYSNKIASTIWVAVLGSLFFCGCAGDKFDQKSYNILAEEVKKEINKLSIPCPVGEKEILVGNLNEVNLKGFEDDTAALEKFKKISLLYEDQEVTIIVNKSTKDGFQFKYSTDITEFALDRKPIITRDEGTIWMYCDDYKKHNEPKAEPEVSPSVMITVE